MIIKVKGGYKVVSENGKKNLGGPYKTKEEAQKRLRQVEYFKHNKWELVGPACLRLTRTPAGSRRYAGICDRGPALIADVAAWSVVGCRRGRRRYFRPSTTNSVESSRT